LLLLKAHGYHDLEGFQVTTPTGSPASRTRRATSRTTPEFIPSPSRGDTEDNLISITDASSNQTAFTYDAFGRATQTNFPSSLSEYYHILAG
jgi:YD repeat-containing protein